MPGWLLTGDCMCTTAFKLVLQSCGSTSHLVRRNSTFQIKQASQPCSWKAPSIMSSQLQSVQMISTEHNLPLKNKIASVAIIFTVKNFRFSPLIDRNFPLWHTIKRQRRFVSCLTVCTTKCTTTTRYFFVL